MNDTSGSRRFFHLHCLNNRRILFGIKRRKFTVISLNVDFLSLTSFILLSLSFSLSSHPILFVPRGSYSCNVAANLVPRALFPGFGKAPWGRGWVSRFSLHFLPRLPSSFCLFPINRYPPGGLWFSFYSFPFCYPSHCYVAVAVLVLF